MTTYQNLKTYLQTDLRDDATTGAFGDTELGDLVNEAIVEIGALVPLEYQEDITVTADTLEYTPRASVFASGDPRVMLSRVEVWDNTTTPKSFVARLQPQAAEYVNQTDTGWFMWAGKLVVPNAVDDRLVVGTHIIRTWGYSPYKPLASNSDVTDVPADLQWPLRECAAAHAADRLLNDRALFQQWMASTHNTDLSAGTLTGILTTKRSNWERRRRQLLAHRVGA